MYGISFHNLFISQGCFYVRFFANKGLDIVSGASFVINLVDRFKNSN